jgi:uncharacterized protein
MIDSTNFKIIDSALGRHLFVVDGSRIYDLADSSFDELELALSELAPAHAPRIDGTPLDPPPLQTLSLTVAQACNMSCGYCYADGGSFNGKPRMMSREVARAAVDRLLVEAAPGAEVVVGFMGGEPFLNRAVIHDIVPYAQEAGRRTGHGVRFSVTTNATVLQPVDVQLMVANRFHVTVSLDGPPDVNDRQRSLLRGPSSHRKVLDALELFAVHGRPRHLSARATVTPRSGALPRVLEHLLALGLDSVGFAPVLSSPDPTLAFAGDQLEALLAQMIECGDVARRRILAGRPCPFSNFETALIELERGTHRPYPCGAGAGYLSADADGALYACHRLVGDVKHHFGDVTTGSDVARRRLHLADSHVDRQAPCKDCWARYLCGGGCYHEVQRRGRVACDYIRGWLAYCIARYAELKEWAPLYFSDPVRYFAGGAANREVTS